MLRTLRALVTGVVVAATSLGWPAAARGQSAGQSGVAVPRIEVAATAGFTQIANAEGDRRWTGPALALVIDGNVAPHLAAVAQVEIDVDHATAFLGGAQISTGFYYGTGRDPVPGRFFAKVLAGVVNAGSGGMHPAGHVACGADILLKRARAVGLRWEAGYELIAGAAAGHGDGRVAIGLIFGPHLRRAPSTAS